jgi:AcrR family transcriptional regulator
MGNVKPDRRIERTRQSLFQALAALSAEKGYTAVTVQDIADRANISRSTFYAHFNSKEALFLHAHFDEFEPFVPADIDLDALLGDAPSPSLIALFEHIQRTRAAYFELLKSPEMPYFQREVRAHFAERLENSLRGRFAESESSVPLTALANYLAASQLNFILWWVESHAPFSPQAMAESIQQMQRAVLRDALHLCSDSVENP